MGLPGVKGRGRHKGGAATPGENGLSTVSEEKGRGHHKGGAATPGGSHKGYGIGSSHKGYGCNPEGRSRIGFRIHQILQAWGPVLVPLLQHAANLPAQQNIPNGFT